MIQGTFGMIQGTFGIIQGTFGIIQGTFRVWFPLRHLLERRLDCRGHVRNAAWSLSMHTFSEHSVNIE
jgi:hypothetical protein